MLGSGRFIFNLHVLLGSFIVFFKEAPFVKVSGSQSVVGGVRSDRITLGRCLGVLLSKYDLQR